MRAALVGRGLLAVGLVAGAAGVVGGQGTAPRGIDLHGEDSVFAGHGVVIAWGVLRAAVESESLVVIRVVAAGDGAAQLDVEASNPFTHTRRAVVTGVPVDRGVEVRMRRAEFGDFPRRDIRVRAAGRGAVTVYYLGVPDTTPEFASEAALRAYLDAAVARAGRGGTP